MKILLGILVFGFLLSWGIKKLIEYGDRVEKEARRNKEKEDAITANGALKITFPILGGVCEVYSRLVDFENGQYIAAVTLKISTIDDDAADVMDEQARKLGFVNGYQLLPATKLDSMIDELENEWSAF